MANAHLEERVVSPLPEGYAARPAMPTDDEAVTRLCNTYSRAFLGYDTVTIEETRLDWGFPGFDLAAHTRVVLTPDGQIVGYGEMWDVIHPTRIYAVGRVHPDHTRLGIATHLVEWAEARARQSIPKAPEGARVALIHQTLSNDESAARVLGKHGYEAVRHFLLMEIRFDGPPPEPVWPEGITVRTFIRDQDEWPMLTAIAEAFKDHWGHIETPLEEEYDRCMYWINEDPGFDPTLWFLAMDGDEIAGVARCWLYDFAVPDMGEVTTLAVRRPWRRRGLGTALLSHAFGELYRRGQTGASLGVDASSLTGATRLYEKAGMHIARCYALFEKELRPGEDLSTQSLD